MIPAEGPTPEAPDLAVRLHIRDRVSALSDCPGPPSRDPVAAEGFTSGKKVAFDSPQGIEALTYWVSLLKFVPFVHQNLTRVRVFVTKMNTSCVRKVRLVSNRLAA